MGIAMPSLDASEGSPDAEIVAHGPPCMPENMDLREEPVVEIGAEEVAIEFSAPGTEVVNEELTAPTLEFTASLAPPRGVAVEVSKPGLATELVVEGEMSIEPRVEIIAPAELIVEGEEIFEVSEIEVVND